jgi:hypothetical protein
LEANRSTIASPFASAETTELTKNIHAPEARFSHTIRARCAWRARGAQLFSRNLDWPSADQENFLGGDDFALPDALRGATSPEVCQFDSSEIKGTQAIPFRPRVV